MYQKGNKELEIISLFRGNYKKRFYLREISKIANMPLKTCQNTLSKLEESKILKSNVEGKNKYFALNLENIKTKLYLQHAEIYQTDKFIEKHKLIKTFLKSTNTAATIIIFGSFAKSLENKNSDLDMLIVSNKAEALSNHLLPSKLHKIKMSEKNFLKAINQQENLIKEIEENHIILNNHSFYVNIMWNYYGN